MSRARPFLSTLLLATIAAGVPAVAAADTDVTFPASTDSFDYTFYPYMFFEGDQVIGQRFVDTLNVTSVSFDLTADTQFLYCDTLVSFEVDGATMAEWLMPAFEPTARLSASLVPLSAQGGRTFTLTLRRETPATEDCGSIILNEDTGTVTFFGTGSSDATDDDMDGFDSDVDCDDQDASVYPGADEPCDGTDNDCDLEIDEEGDSTFYYDNDSDGWGDSAHDLVSCSPPDGFVPRGGDCDDGDSAVFPTAQEACDTQDNDCDGVTDEGAGVLWFRDADRDGYGSDSDVVEACDAPSGYVASPGDCDDSTGAVHPAASEVCDGRDNNCNGLVDDRDVDADGYYAAACGGDDCNDNRADINPGAEELPGDLTDNDCDGAVDESEGPGGCQGSGRAAEGASLMWITLLAGLGAVRRRR